MELDLGQNILQLIQTNQKLFFDFTEGAINLSVNEIYHEIKEDITKLYELDFLNDPAIAHTKVYENIDNNQPTKKTETYFNNVSSLEENIMATEAMAFNFVSYFSLMTQRISTLPLLMQELLKNFKKSADETFKYVAQSQNLEKLLEKLQENGKFINQEIKSRLGKITLEKILDNLVDKNGVKEKYNWLFQEALKMPDRAPVQRASTMPTRSEKKDSQKTAETEPQPKKIASERRPKIKKRTTSTTSYVDSLKHASLHHFDKIQVLKYLPEDHQILYKNHYCFLFDKYFILFEERNSDSDHYKIAINSWNVKNYDICSQNDLAGTLENSTSNPMSEFVFLKHYNIYPVIMLNTTHFFVNSSNSFYLLGYDNLANPTLYCFLENNVNKFNEWVKFLKAQVTPIENLDNSINFQKNLQYPGNLVTSSNRLKNKLKSLAVQAHAHEDKNLAIPEAAELDSKRSSGQSKQSQISNLNLNDRSYATLLKRHQAIQKLQKLILAYKNYQENGLELDNQSLYGKFFNFAAIRNFLTKISQNLPETYNSQFEQNWEKIFCKSYQLELSDTNRILKKMYKNHLMHSKFYQNSDLNQQTRLKILYFDIFKNHRADYAEYFKKVNFESTLAKNQKKLDIKFLPEFIQNILLPEQKILMKFGFDKVSISSGKVFENRVLYLS